LAGRLIFASNLKRVLQKVRIDENIIGKTLDTQTNGEQPFHYFAPHMRLFSRKLMIEIFSRPQ